MSNADGQATLEYQYPRNYAPWVDMVIGVYGESAGSEDEALTPFTLELLGDDLSDEGQRHRQTHLV